MKKRVHNFSAGPATLPVEILEAIESELYDYEGIGSSIIEISHRDIVFKEVAKKAEISVRKLLSIPEDYDVIFMQGGATLQFSYTVELCSVRDNRKFCRCRLLVC